MQVMIATFKDARAIAEIHVEAWCAAYKSIVPADYLASLSIERCEAVWSDYIAAGNPKLLVAKQAGSVRGWIRFGECRDNGSHETDAEVWAIYVSPAAWSKGVGRVLWIRARELMIEQGFKSCSLWVFPQNERGIKFYHSVGLVHDGAAPKSFELGGVQLEEVRFITRF